MHPNFPVRLFAILRTALFALLFMGTVGIYLPLYLGLMSRSLPPLSWHSLGWISLLLGAFIALRCALAFAWTGEGTPAPFDPPRHLVLTGWYRYVRNPMYIGMALFLIGAFILVGTSLKGALIYLASLALGVTIFVVLYEEPTLRGKFPEEYSEYCRHVSRFVPRLTAWNPSKAKGTTSSR